MRTLKQIIQGVGTGIALSLAVAGCGELERQACLSNNFREAENAELITCPVEPINKTPVATITTDFLDGLNGVVKRTFNATDSDGIVQSIYISYDNGQSWQIVQSGYNEIKAISSGLNPAKAYAVDNKGLAGKVVADDFTPATEAEARGVIEERLVDNPTAYENFFIDTNITIGENCQIYSQDIFNVDYYINLLTAINLSTNSILEYISPTDDLNQKLSEKQKLDCAGIRSLYFHNLPESIAHPEISSRVNSFIDNGFQ